MNDPAAIENVLTRICSAKSRVLVTLCSRGEQRTFATTLLKFGAGDAWVACPEARSTASSGALAELWLRCDDTVMVFDAAVADESWAPNESDECSTLRLTALTPRGRQDEWAASQSSDSPHTAEKSCLN